jgi:hypothetical protein
LENRKVPGKKTHYETGTKNLLFALSLLREVGSTSWVLSHIEEAGEVKLSRHSDCAGWSVTVLSND